jgi:hypothetical protein
MKDIPNGEVNIYTLAKNAGTSVSLIEPFEFAICR